MKVFNCVCEFGHEFEGWFDSSESLDEQIKEHLVVCPRCNSTEIRRLPTASYIMASRDKSKPEYTVRQMQAELREKALSAARTLVKNSEYVGDRFASEARAVHNGTAPQRTIHGQCTLEQAEELIEEGIGVLPLPDDVVHETN